MPTDRDGLPEADRADGCAHPRETYDLIGHQKAEQKIIESLNGGRLHHAWLFSGVQGIGKATLAYRMIRALLGGRSRLQNSLDIPASDPVAQRVESLGHGDFFLLRRPYDHKTKKLRREIPVDEARKLTEFFSKRPSEGGWRVCLIDAMDDMNRNSENAILKTLEEPPDRAVLILLSHQPGKLLPTIRSRCMSLSLREVPILEIEGWLKSRSKASPETLKNAAFLSRGAPGRALSLVQNADTILTPLARFQSGLGKDNALADQKFANLVSTAQTAETRHLIWDGLQDLIHAEAVHAATGEWNMAFGPSGLLRGAEDWHKIWERLKFLQNREAALNMDKKTVMIEALSAIRRG